MYVYVVYTVLFTCLSIALVFLSEQINKMPICCVVGSFSRNQKDGPEVSFFTFPSDTVCECQLVCLVNNTRSVFEKTAYSRVCCAISMKLIFKRHRYWNRILGHTLNVHTTLGQIWTKWSHFSRPILHWPINLPFPNHRADLGKMATKG